MPRTVLLVPSNELGWAEIRETIRNHPAFRLAGEVQALDFAERPVTLAECRPQLILAGTSIRDRSTLPLLTALRARCQEAILAVFAAHLDEHEAYALTALGATGYLAWHDLDRPTLSRSLELLGTGRMLIISRSLAPVVIPALHRARIESRRSELSDWEQRVLRWLAAGLTEKEIAASEGASRRTVERTIARLKRRFEAPNLFALGVRVCCEDVLTG